MAIQNIEFRIQNPEFRRKCASFRISFHVRAIETASRMGDITLKLLPCNILDTEFWILNSVRFNKVESHPVLDYGGERRYNIQA